MKKEKPTPKRDASPRTEGDTPQGGNAKRTTHSRRKKGGRQHRHS